MKVDKVIRTEILISDQNSRKTDKTIRSLIPKQCIDQVEALLGKEAATRAKSTMRDMEKNGLEFVQLRIKDHRVRIKQTEIA